MVEKRVKKFGQGPPPPYIRAMPERKRFFLIDVFPNDEVADMLVDMKVNKVANEVARRAPRLVGHIYSVQYWCFCFVSWRLSFVCIWIMRGHLCSFHLHTADRRNNAWHCTSSLIIRTTVSWKYLPAISFYFCNVNSSEMSPSVYLTKQHMS